MYSFLVRAMVYEDLISKLAAKGVASQEADAYLLTHDLAAIDGKMIPAIAEQIVGERGGAIAPVSGELTVASSDKPVVKRGRKPKSEAIAPLKDKALEQGQGASGRATDFVIQAARAGYENPSSGLSAKAYLAGLQLRFSETVAAGLSQMGANLGTFGAVDEEAIASSLSGLAEGWSTEVQPPEATLDFWG